MSGRSPPPQLTEAFQQGPVMAKKKRKKLHPWVASKAQTEFYRKLIDWCEKAVRKGLLERTGDFPGDATERDLDVLLEQGYVVIRGNVGFIRVDEDSYKALVAIPIEGLEGMWIRASDEIPAILTSELKPDSQPYEGCPSWEKAHVGERGFEPPEADPA